MIARRVTLSLIVLALSSACERAVPPVASEYVGTDAEFASEAVYFVVTDRFVDGDPGNNFPKQGGAMFGTFDIPIQLPDRAPANIGYLGGDFKGIVENAGYIADMGFTALWITPIVDNPDEAFSGSTPPGQGAFADKGKAGYHGYWGVNFFTVDEHLESQDLKFADLTRILRDDHRLKLVLDIVNNHGSPAYTMPVDQPGFGEIYDANGNLVADHQNRHPNDLDPHNPLHAFYNTEPDLAQLSDLNESNPDVLDYLVAAHSQWIDRGAAAFRIDTIKHMPHEFWKAFSDRIRADRPDFFMFAESWSFDAHQIAMHTYPENGGISVLDFPGQKAMNEVFADGAPYTQILPYLHLDDGLYENPYELMIFYDNHDMARMNADADGFIDANNWLFTSRGIPVVYYGSEIGFQAGAGEHGGNRNYFGRANIGRALTHTIREKLSSIAHVRKRYTSLQRGLQVNLAFTADTAAFYRVYSHEGTSETALVLLNKSDDSQVLDISDWVGGLVWHDAMTGSVVDRGDVIRVNAHSVCILVSDDVPDQPGIRDTLDALQASSRRRTAE